MRKPLVLMTPKSLLRNKRCVSRLGEMGMASSFQRILLDDAEMTVNEQAALKPDELPELDDAFVRTLGADDAAVLSCPDLASAELTYPVVVKPVASATRDAERTRATAHGDIARSARRAGASDPDGSERSVPVLAPAGGPGVRPGADDEAHLQIVLEFRR